MKLIRLLLCTSILVLLPSWALAQSVVQLCVPRFNATTGAFSCVPVGQTSPNITTINGLPVGGVANAVAPTFVEAASGYLSFDLSGNLRTSGTFTPSGSSPEFTPIVPATATATRGVLLGTQYNSTQATFTDGQQGSVQATARGALMVAVGADGFAVTSTTQAPVAPATATATKSDLIGAQATTAAVNPTNGQQSALSSDTNNNLLTSSGGAPNLTTAQVTVTTSNTAVVAARALRRSVTITNITGTQQVYCSGTTATTGNGQLIPAVVGASWNVSTTAAINCIAVSSSQTVSTSETF